MPSPTQQEATPPQQNISPPLDDLPITPLSPSAPAPSCICTSEWEHTFFACQALYRMPRDSYLDREHQREKAWTAILRGQTFCLGGLKKVPETTPIYHALRQEKAVLLHFLPLWHEEIRRDWKNLFEDQKNAQEDVILRGMEVFNRIVTLLLRRENERAVYGEMEMDEEMREELGRLVFDLGGLEIGEEGVVGRPALGYHDPESCSCDDKGSEETQNNEGEDAPIGEEKDRHDSGVAMEADQEIALEEVQNAGKHGGGNDESSSDDEDGGVPLDTGREEVHVADEKIEQVHVGDEQIGKQQEEGQIGDETTGNDSEEEYAVDEKEEAPWRKLVSDRDFGLLFERRYHVGDWDDSE